eukprot:9383039-Pyramimonas_sp.AAC.1
MNEASAAGGRRPKTAALPGEPGSAARQGSGPRLGYTSCGQGLVSASPSPHPEAQHRSPKHSLVKRHSGRGGDGHTQPQSHSGKGA